EQHPIRRTPGHGEAGRLVEGQALRLGYQVSFRDEKPLRKRTVVLLREQGTLWVQGLVAVAPVRRGDNGVDHHRIAEGVVSRGVAAEDARQVLWRVADAAKRPQVVHVQRRGNHADEGPSWPGRGGGDI